MKRTILVLSIILLALAVGCTENKENLVCTADAKLCDDGTAVGRNPNNNCEFFPCPTTDKKYVSNNLEECKTLLYQCLPGSSPFNDAKGCGCEAPQKKFVSKDLDECSRIRYMCEQGTRPFTNEIGCGCEFDWEQKPQERKKQAVECTENDRKVAGCTKEYMPVCGWFGEFIKCIKYPCAATYGNKCEACRNPNVAYYTEGECPKEGEEILY